MEPGQDNNKGSDPRGVRPQNNHSDLNFSDNPVIAKYLARSDNKSLRETLKKYDHPNTTPTSQPRDLLDENGAPIINSASQQKALAEWNATKGAPKGSDPKAGQTPITGTVGAGPKSQNGVPGGTAATAQSAGKIANSLQTGDTSAVLEGGADMAKNVGGKWLVDFLWYSTLEVFPGALYGLPGLNIYMLIGIFVQSPEWHQLSIWKIITIILMDLLVIFLILLLIITIIYAYCTGLTGAVTKAASTVGLIPDYCSSFGIK
jgi:hypothetical protein